jgi:Zn-dependent protease with chaperone function
MDEFHGLYFDGQSSRAVPVVVRVLANGEVLLQDHGPDRQQELRLELRQPLAQLRLEQPPGRSRPRLHWPGGGVVEMHEDSGLGSDGHRLAALFASRPAARLPGLLRWAESHRAGALGACLLALATVIPVLIGGLPLLASVVSAAIPPAAERQLGEAVLSNLDQQIFTPSRLPQASQRRVRNLMAQLQATTPKDLRLRLELRHSPTIGANALCLPGAILVVTDDLAKLATDDELLAVLAHEAGHAQHRHPLQKLVRSHALALASNGVGASDNPTRAIAEGLVGNAYSREFEHQADREAVALLRRLNRSPAPFFSILDKLEKEQGKTGLPSFLRTHPNNRERRAKAAGG